MRPVLPALALGALAAGVAVGAVARPPAAPSELSDASADPMVRAALVATPAIYRLEIETLTRKGRRRARAVDLLNATAFGVGDARVRGVRRSVVVTARHNVARPPGGRILSIRLFPAVSGDMEEGPAPGPVAAGVLARGRGNRDLALLWLSGPAGRPALRLQDGQTQGTPVVVPGFGGTAGPAPTLRRGEIVRVARIRHDASRAQFAALSTPIRLGDSGAPLVDETGSAHGVIVRRATRTEPPIAEQAGDVRRLLRAAGATQGEGARERLFRLGMDSFWRRRYGDAHEALERASAGAASHPLAAFEAVRAADLATAAYRVEHGDRWRGILIALGAASALAAAAFLVALVLGERTRRRLGH